MSINSSLRSLRQRGSEHQALAAVQFLMKHNMVEREECSTQIESESAPSSPTHRYLAEEYDFSNCCFLITDGCNIDD